MDECQEDEGGRKGTFLGHRFTRILRIEGVTVIKMINTDKRISLYLLLSF